MRVRRYEDRDRAACEKMAKDLNVAFCDPNDPATILNLVLEDDDGTVLANLFGRVTVEAVLAMNQDHAKELRVHRKNGMPWLWTVFAQEMRKRRLGEIYTPICPWMNRFADYLVKRLGFYRDNRLNLVYVLRSHNAPVS